MVPEKYQKPTSILDCAIRLSDLGYWPVPIPAGCKGPTIDGWQNLRITFENAAEYFTESGMLIGILHNNVLAFDVDVYDADLAQTIVDEGLRRFPGALERIGQEPKSALFLRMEEPGFKIKSTEKHSKDDLTAQVEVRSVTRQIVVYGKHPDTKQPYRWPRGELWETPWIGLPEATQDEVQRFRDWCNDQIKKWAGAADPKIIDLGNYSGPRTFADEKICEDGFIEALSHIPANVGYDEWIAVLMGIHDYFDGSQRGLDAANSWSSPYPDYTPQEVAQKWRSFEIGKGSTYKTVLHIAKQNGADLASLAKPPAPSFQIDTGSAVQQAESYVEKIDSSDLFRPWEPLNPLTHPRRDFIYGKHYIRKFASVTVAPGGLGKSSLVLAECIAIATGKALLGIVPKQRERVVYFNAEDPREEIERRVLAICQHHQIDQSELSDWFYFQSGRDLNLILSAGDDGQIIEPVFELIENFAASVRPGVFAFDPLANMTEAPETNDVFRRLGKRISHMADKLDCSVELVHHTRKLNGNEATVEDSRGGSALIGAVRAGRVLNPMTSDEAIKAGLETHIDHFRIEAAGKNNLSRGDERSTWLRRVDVEIANGEHVAAVDAWDWPDAFDGVTKEDARRVQVAISSMDNDPPRANVQSSAWAGYVVARVLGLDAEDKAGRARVNTLIKGWIKSQVLALDEVRDTRNGRDVKVVVAGSNNPTAEVST